MKCKYEHDSDCCNAGADQYMCKCKKPCEFIWPLTNADHIRSMTDEELVAFMTELMFRTPCFGEGMFPYHPCPQDQDCKKCGLDWLKQPYEEDGNG